MALNNEQLQAAHLLILKLDPTDATITWEGFTSPVIELNSGKLPHRLEDFTKLLSSQDSSKIMNSLRQSEDTEFSITFPKAADWIFRVNTSAKFKNQIFLHCCKYSKSELKRLEAADNLNQYLERQLAEAHHRTKNTLQNIISYINVILGRKEIVTKQDHQKLTRFIHALTSLHDVLLSAISKDGDGKSVNFDKIIKDVLDFNSQNKPIEYSEIPELTTSSRCAATTALIFNELLDNAIRHGENAKVTIKESQVESKAFITVANSILRKEPENVMKGSTLKLLEGLCKADLKSNLEIFENADTYQVTVSFPLKQT